MSLHRNFCASSAWDHLTAGAGTEPLARGCNDWIRRGRRASEDAALRAPKKALVASRPPRGLLYLSSSLGGFFSHWHFKRSSTRFQASIETALQCGWPERVGQSPRGCWKGKGDKSLPVCVRVRILYSILGVFPRTQSPRLQGPTTRFRTNGCRALLVQLRLGTVVGQRRLESVDLGLPGSPLSTCPRTVRFWIPRDVKEWVTAEDPDHRNPVDVKVIPP